MNPPMHHTIGYRIKQGLRIGFIISGVCFFVVGIIWLRMKANENSKIPRALNEPIEVEVKSVYKFYPEDGVAYKEIKNVGLTYYRRYDGYTPGHTTRSGRFVYEGGLAVSQPLWQKEVWPGDLIYVKATNRWYKVEDTMHAKYTEPRIDIYTDDMNLAKSGSSKTDIIIMRQPK